MAGPDSRAAPQKAHQGQCADARSQVRGPPTYLCPPSLHLLRLHVPAHFRLASVQANHENQLVDTCSRCQNERCRGTRAYPFSRNPEARMLLVSFIQRGCALRAERAQLPTSVGGLGRERQQGRLAVAAAGLRAAGLAQGERALPPHGDRLWLCAGARHLRLTLRT